ncbi:MAG: caspase family protein [Tannerellaceae bacterium]|nr:caspase family protein [Tannerellaceae bacterium]
MNKRIRIFFLAGLCAGSLCAQQKSVTSSSAAASVGLIRLGADTLAVGEIPAVEVPPVLEIYDLSFSGMANEGALSAEEKGYLRFRIRNIGRGDAYNLHLYVSESNGLAGLGYDNHKFIAKRFEAGETRLDSIVVNGRTNLPTGRAYFGLFLSEANGNRSETVEASLKTRESGVAKADIANDKLYRVGDREFRLQFSLQNTGSSHMDSVKILVAYPKSVYAKGESAMTIEQLRPDESKEIAFSFVKNRNFDENTKDVFTVTLADATGRTIGMPKNIARTKETDNADGTGMRTGGTTLSVMSEVDFDIPRSANEFKNAHVYVLIIGNEKYTGNQEVPFAEKDALMFSQYCLHTFNIPAENVICRTNATGNQMKQALRDLTRKAMQNPDPNTEIIIYYSGHGIIAKDKYGMANDEFDQYLLPVDVIGADASLSLSRKDIYAALNETPFKRASIFLDACNVKGDRAVAKVAKTEWKGDVFVFASSLPNQTSGSYNEKGHGMFTYFLLKSIQDKKGKVTYNDLTEEVIKGVEWQSDAIADKKQNPEIISSPQVGENWRRWKFPE